MKAYNKIENAQITERLPTLPERKILATGQTISGFNTLLPAVLKALGYLPEIRKPINPETQYYPAQPTITEDAVIYPALPRDKLQLQALAKQQIDQTAGDARVRFIPAGLLLDQEYLLAKQDAMAFKVAGYPVDAVPTSIAVSMVARKTTAVEEADAILARAAQLETVLVEVRRIRLVGKAAVDDALDNDAVIAARDHALAVLNAL